MKLIIKKFFGGERIESEGSRYVRSELGLLLNKPFYRIYITGGFTANTSLSMFCRDNGLLLHICGFNYP